MGFTKLDERILQSSIMAEDSDTFKIWVALLASCRPDGLAPVSSVFLASVCHLPIEIVDTAIAKLEAPDPRSRSLKEEGRRIKRVNGGYFLINYSYYRGFTYSEKPESVRKREYRWEKEAAEDRDNPGQNGTFDGTFGTTPGHSASASVFSFLDRGSGEGGLEKGAPGKHLKSEAKPSWLGPEKIDTDLTQKLIDMMRENNPTSIILNRLTMGGILTWANQCRLLRERDGKTPEQISAVIDFSQRDPFWKTNILSMPKLRQKFDQLWLKAKNGAGGLEPRASRVGETNYRASKRAKEIMDLVEQRRQELMTKRGGPLTAKDKEALGEYSQGLWETK